MSSGWQGFAASQLGSTHRLRGVPNQDSYGLRRAGAALAAVVADGHGHRAHFRSGDGSRIAVATFLDLVDQRPGGDLDSENLQAFLLDLTDPLVRMWRQRVVADASARPFSSGEVTLLGGDSEQDLAVAYGSTVVAVVATSTALGFLQLGDGDAVLAFGDGEVVRPLPEDPLLDGVRTTSLCQPDATASVRVAAVDVTRRAVSLAFVSTDGFGAPRVDAHGWWRQVGEELGGHVSTHGSAWVESRLADWLVEPAEVGGDDTTVAVLVAVTSPQ